MSKIAAVDSPTTGFCNK